jgi:hypothetical protein
MLASPSDIERGREIVQRHHAPCNDESLLCSGFCSLVLLLLEEINFILFFIFQEGIDSTIVTSPAKSSKKMVYIIL